VGSVPALVCLLLGRASRRLVHQVGRAFPRRDLARLTFARTWKILLVGQFMNICVPARVGDVAYSPRY
jgi:hypothetical protein